MPGWQCQQLAGPEHIHRGQQQRIRIIIRQPEFFVTYRTVFGGAEKARVELGVKYSLSYLVVVAR